MKSIPYYTFALLFILFFRYVIQSGLKDDNYIFFYFFSCFIWLLMSVLYDCEKMNEKVIFCFFTHVIHTEDTQRWTERKRTQIKN